KTSEKDLEAKIILLRKEKESDPANAAKYDAAIAKEQDALEELNAKKRKENLKDDIALAKAAAGQDEVLALQEKLNLEDIALLDAQQNDRKEEEREITKDILLTTQQLANAEAKRVDMQAQFNFELSKAKEQRREEVNSQYRPA